MRRSVESPGAWTHAIFLLVILGLFAAEVLTNYSPVKLSVLLFVLFWIPLLVLHETAHAVMAAIVGWRVERVVIGMGRLVKTFRVGNATVEWKLLPLEGFARSVPLNLRFPGLKHALIYVAGPGIELLLAATILWLVGPQLLFSSSKQYSLIAWQSLSLAATVGGVLNLIPQAAQMSSGMMIPNDGLRIILSLSRPASAYAAWMAERQTDQNYVNP